MGLLLLAAAHPAGIQDRDGARLVFEAAKGKCPTLRLVWADGGDAGERVGWSKRTCGWVPQIVERGEEVTGFVVLPRRWVVGRAITWVNDHRRLRKGYEFHTQTSEASIRIATIHVMLRRLANPKLVTCGVS